MILFWLLTNKKYALISILSIILTYPILFKTIHFGNNVPKVGTEGIFEVSSYNVARLHELENQKTADFYSHIEKLYNDEVIVFQEVNSSFKNKIKKMFPRDNHIDYPRKTTYIVSKYPIIDSGILDFGQTENSCIYADLDISGTRVRIYNAHLQSNSITNMVNKVTSQVDLNDEESWKDISSMIQRYNKATQKRLEQVRIMKKHIEKCPYPAIVAGDMNDVPQSYMYKELSKGLQDGFLKRGNGMGISFSGKIPTLRIDYIFATKPIRFLGFNTHRTNYSDHYAISSRVELE